MSDDTTPAKKRAPRRRKAKPPAQQAGVATAPAVPKVAPEPPVTKAAGKAKAAKRPTAPRKSRSAHTPSRDADNALAARDEVIAASLPEASAAPIRVLPTPRSLIRVPLAVRWRDLDAFNHVNNSKYLSYLEEARLQWMLTLPGQGLDEHVAPVVAAAHLNYRRPIEWPCDVVIELFVERLGNTSVTVGHRILGDSDGTQPILFCDGNVVMVWIDRSSGAAAALPGPVREACS